jgi:2-haloacid dehalogenase
MQGPPKRACNGIHLALFTEFHKNPDKIARMQPDIKAIVFDFGGVLLDWDPRYLYRRYFPNNPQDMDQFLTEVNFYEWNAKQDQGRPFSEGIAELSNQFPQHAGLIQTYFDQWEESISGPIHGSIKILHQLKQKGYPLYGLSNWSAETYPRALRKYSFFNVFDDVVLSGAVKLNKPDPAIFRLLLDKIEYRAPECVLIDDSKANIETAKELGFVTIHFKSSEQLQTELQRLNLL